MSKENYAKYVSTLQKIADVNYATAVLGWDKEVHLPEGSTARRSQQMATLSGIAHELATSKDLGELLKTLSAENGLDERQRCNVVESLKDFNKTQKFTTDFVINKSKKVSATYHGWIEARKANDFSVYAKQLEDLVEVAKQEADLLGYENHPLDALLDLYDPASTVENVSRVFDGVKPDLIELLNKIKACNQIDDSLMKKHYPKNQQWDFGMFLLEQMGYNFKNGRQDVSPHPFTTSFSSEDVRVTTRIDENNFYDMTWSCVHEGGHALYEQGLRAEDYGLPTGSAESLSVHESQSRLWENNVARGKAYWEANFAKLQSYFPENLNGVSLDEFYKCINKVEPSLIRTDADEITYHFHVIIRYEIEKGLLDGSIKVKDLKEVWNSKYKAYLGVDVPSDNQGVLQDVHWAHGSIGYFPTYTLGSFYAAQYFEQATKEIPTLQADIANGKLLELRNWLKDKIHDHGRLYNAEELCKKVTGKGLDPDCFMKYATEKYSKIYGF